MLFSAASEIAVVSINKNRIEQKAHEGDVKSQKLLKILQNPTNFLSTIQEGITLVNILSGASLANTLSERLAPVLGGGTAAKNIANIIVLAILTYDLLFWRIGNRKCIALNKSERSRKIDFRADTLDRRKLSPLSGCFLLLQVCWHVSHR